MRKSAVAAAFILAAGSLFAEYAPEKWNLHLGYVAKHKEVRRLAAPRGGGVAELEAPPPEVRRLAAPRVGAAELEAPPPWAVSQGGLTLML